MCAKAAGIATRSRPAPCWPTPSARGWSGVDSPISTPDEFVYDSPHMFGTKRTGPDLSRVGGKYDTQWHRTHFRNPRDLVPGSVMPPFPWIVEQRRKSSQRWWPTSKRWAAPRTGVRTTTTRNEDDYTCPSVYLRVFLLHDFTAWLAVYFFVRSLEGRLLGQGQRGSEISVFDYRRRRPGRRERRRIERHHGTEQNPKIKEYADGWITEREGTDVPGFLKLAYHRDRGRRPRVLSSST